MFLGFFHQQQCLIQSIFFHYSLEKFFFVSWQEELLRMNPESARWIRPVSAAVNAYRRLARLLGTGVEGWVLAVSPLTFRGGIAHSARTEEEAAHIHEHTLAALQAVARSERLPLCFYGIEADDDGARYYQLFRQSAPASQVTLLTTFDAAPDDPWQSNSWVIAGSKTASGSTTMVG